MPAYNDSPLSPPNEPDHVHFLESLPRSPCLNELTFAANRMTSRASSPPLEYTPLEELYAFLETNPEKEPILSEIQALESIYLPENIRVWPISLSHPDSAQAKTRFEVVSSLQSPHEDVPLHILVTLRAAYPESSSPQLQLLSRYVGAFSVDPELSGLVLRTYFSSLTGIAWSPGDIAVFDGIEHVRERATTWYQERLSEKTAGQLQRENNKESHAHEPAVEVGEPVVKEPTPAVELPAGIEFTIAEPITDRKSVFIGRACKITHPSQVPVILAYLMADKRIARAAHPIINAWRCTVGDVMHQDNDDDGESAAGRGLAHLLQIMELDHVLVVVTRFFGGIHLGPDRFKWINQSARNALEQGGFLEQAPANNVGGRKGKRRG